MRPCRWLALVALLLGLAGCSRPKADVPADETPSRPATAPAASAAPVSAVAPAPAAVVAAPTEPECEALATDLETAARDGKADEVRKFIDADALLDRASLDNKARRELIAKPSASGDLAALIASRAATGGSCRFVRLKMAEDGWRLLFRLTVLDGRVNYHELIPQRRPDGRVRVVDALVYSTGETHSAALRRETLPALQKAAAGGADVGLTPLESDLLRHWPGLMAIRAALNAGDGREATRLVEALPETLQKDKGVMLLRARAALRAGERSRLALAALERQFPGDPCVELAQMEALMRQNRPSELLAVVDRLDRAVGGDVYLDTIRANVCLATGNAAEARQAADRVAQALPDLPTTYLLRLAISLHEKDHAETARWLTVLRERAGISLGEIESNEAYAEFVRSPEYRRWAAKK